MEKIKKYLSIFLFIIFLVTATNAYAQTTMSLKFGANYSNLIFRNESGNRISTQFNPGFQLGIGIITPISGSFYFQPSILYARKGFIQKDGWFAHSGNTLYVNVSYIELPLNFLFKPSLGNGKFLVGTGFYLEYGVGGKWKTAHPIRAADVIFGDHGDVNFINGSKTSVWTGNYLYGKPLDYGTDVLVGYEFFNQIIVQFNVKFGLRNLEPSSDYSKRNVKSLKNIGFGITLGYKLWSN